MLAANPTLIPFKRTAFGTSPAEYPLILGTALQNGQDRLFTENKITETGSHEALVMLLS